MGAKGAEAAAEAAACCQLMYRNGLLLLPLLRLGLWKAKAAPETGAGAAEDEEEGKRA